MFKQYSSFSDSGRSVRRKNNKHRLTASSSENRVDVGVSVLVNPGPEQHRVDEYVHGQKHEVHVVVSHVRQRQLVRSKRREFAPR